MAIPQLTPMPPAPVPTDPENVFDQKAGDYLVAQVRLVEELNEDALPFVDQQRQLAETARTQSQASATASAGSASAAAQSAVDAAAAGAAQVTLAETARAGAETARDSAQAAQEAAQAGAGIPEDGNPGDALLRTPGGGVGFLPIKIPDQSINIIEQYAAGTSLSRNNATPAYFTRQLNTLKRNTITGASFSAASFVLPPGTYRVQGIFSGATQGGGKVRLFNVTSGVVTLLGLNCAVENDCTLDGVITVAEASSFRIEQFFSVNAASLSYGINISTGETNTYGALHITKLVV